MPDNLQEQQIEKKEQTLKDIMHKAIDDYILHIDHYIHYIHDRTAPEYKNIPIDLRETLKGYGVDELQRFHITKLIHDEDTVIERYVKQIVQSNDPKQKLKEVFDSNLFVNQDVYLGRVFKFNDAQKEIMQKIVDEISLLNKENSSNTKRLKI